MRYSTNPRINALYELLARRYWCNGFRRPDNPVAVATVTNCAVYGGYHVAKFERGARR